MDTRGRLTLRSTPSWASKSMKAPEVMGAHIGPPRSHTTGRRHSLGFRAATALFWHLGVEWNLLTLREHFGRLEGLRIAYIGDSATMDIGGARAAGLHGILLDPHDDHAGADFERIRSLMELL